MKVKANKIRLQYTEDRKTEIILSVEGNIQQEVEELKQITAKGKELSVEIKQFRQKRSLDSNGYMWVLLGELAEKLLTSKDELYLLMLDRYGVYTHIVVKPNMVDKVKQEWKITRELGPVVINGQDGIQLQCYFGSSTYDTKEMARLLEGVVAECKEVGIDTATPGEIERLNNSWGK